ncbi:deaminase [Streptomyces griseus]|uniref:deaminase n=1 Tax=Streptomyces griseus TaxID=1911 RepID=UPI00379F64A7
MSAVRNRPRPPAEDMTKAPDRSWSGAFVILAEGRNHAYDTGPGNGPLRGTPLAHAELNALGSARTEWDLGATTLWSTQEPCSMCSAAASFTGVGAVRYLAPDPWALATGNEGSSSGTCVTGGGWLVAANVMFLKSVSEAAEGGGAGHTRAQPPAGAGDGSPARRSASRASDVPVGAGVALGGVAGDHRGNGRAPTAYRRMKRLCFHRAAWRPGGTRRSGRTAKDEGALHGAGAGGDPGCRGVRAVSGG